MINTSSKIRCIITDIIKSSEDARKYLGIQLENGLKALLISDSKTDMSAACLDVNIGHYLDPDDLPGLAHFCEHMLFMGTKKYPDENDFSKFLSEHGGYSNAYTDSQNTNYHFNVSPDQLKPALDRFAQFFISPLFTEGATSRELRAVNSENDKNLKNDKWRMDQLEMSTCPASHPYSKFGTGNLETLEILPKKRNQSVREALLQFHEKYYSSNIMALTVIGKESLDELTTLVESLFSEIENKNVVVPSWPQHPFGPDQLKKIIKVVPTKNTRSLKVIWPLPDLRPFYKSKPEHYVSHLIGHEGEGSLLSEMKNKGWANYIEAGEGDGAKGFSFFTIQLELTPKGIDHVNEVILTIFEYINMLKHYGPLEWIFRECQNLSAIDFKFKDEETSIDYASSCSTNMQLFPFKEALSGDHLFDEYNPDLINMVINQLTPQLIRVFVADKKFKDICNLKEKWYGTKYSLESISEDVIQKWSTAAMNENLTLPMKNDFIATDFSLLPRDETSTEPILLRNTSLSRLWYLQDKEFNLPKACINIKFTCPFMKIDPLRVNYAGMFLLLLQDALKEFAYNAQLADVKYYINCENDSFILFFLGFNEKMCTLIEQVVAKFSNLQIDPDRFEINLEQYIRKLKNFGAMQPNKQATYYLKLLLTSHLFSQHDLLETVDEVTFEGMKIFMKNVFSRIFIETLAYGNISKEIALAVESVVEKLMEHNSCCKPLLPSQNQALRQIKIPDGSSYMFVKENTVHKSNALEVYYQCGLQDTHHNMLLELFCQIIDEPCFDILRTQEQLGYLVYSSYMRLYGVQGLTISVQSDRHPAYLQQRIDLFLDNMKKLIVDLTEDQLEKHRAALRLKRLEKPKNIQSRQDKFWTEIDTKFYQFDRDQVEADYLGSITKDQLVNFFQNLESKSFRKLSVEIVASETKKKMAATEDDHDSLDSKSILIENEWMFRQKMHLYDFPAVKRVPSVAYKFREI